MSSGNKRKAGSSRNINMPAPPQRRRRAEGDFTPSSGVLAGGSTPQIVGFEGLQELEVKSQQMRLDAISMLGNAKRAELKDMRREHDLAADRDSDVPMGAPSDHGSRAGSPEYEELGDDATLGTMADAVFSALYSEQKVKRYVPKWKESIRSLHKNWEKQLDKLADAYINWKSNGQGPSPEPEPAAGDTASEPTPETFEIVIIDMFNIDQTTLTVVLPQHETLAPHLTARGYLPTTPVNASLAISLKTLQFYKYLRQRKASFSIEAFAKVLCDLYGHPFRRRWSKAFAAAFDVFVSITVIIENRVNAVLKRDTENWRVLNTCPACFYELEGEPSLRYRVLCAMDGNTSLKRLIDKGTADARQYTEARYIIPPAEVDAMEKKNSHVNAIVAGAPQVTDEEGDNTTSDTGGSGGLPEADELEVEDSDTKASDCTRNWKAAQSDSSKKAMGFFDETGVFACSCRHGIVLWMADMIQSGELFKYPLAIVNRALTVLGDRLLIGYDIGCTFGITVLNSLLAEVFKNSGSRIVVASYHGYAHNFRCQVYNHPSNVEGAGLEDFETLERLWSGSNAVAILVRNATRYRRHMFIEMYMKQSDADKYLAIGDMLLGNYKQALDIIEREGVLLKVALEVEDAKEEDLDQWQTEQREYFGSKLGRESDVDVVRIAYVEMLKEWHAAVRDSENKSSAFLHTIPDHFNLHNPGAVTYQSADSQTRHLETARRRARERALNLDIELQEYENKLSLPERWTRESVDFKETEGYIQQRAYHQALNNLQRLVVQRLFELHRLNLSGVGYKARTLLADSMRKRSAAIRRAIEKYNSTVRAMGRQDTLDWERAAKYSFIEEFDLLKEGQANLADKRWKEPTIREMMKKHQRIKRAREEIERLNIEIQRVYSSTKSEEAILRKALDDLAVSKDSLRCVVEDYTRRRVRVNTVIRARLDKIVALPGYTGSPLKQGRRKGTLDDAELTETLNASVPNADVDAEEGGIGVSEDYDEAQIGGFIDILSDLTIG